MDIEDDDALLSSRYHIVKFIDEGQFACVYKAEDLQNNKQIVAIKKILLGNAEECASGLNRSALREIKILKEFKHPNILKLLDCFGKESQLLLVYEFLEYDLEKVIHSTLVLGQDIIKNYMLQLLQGMYYLHTHWVLHRDLKPNNLLLNKSGVLKICDFGLARSFGDPTKCYTSQVVTRWYRAPELLFASSNYGTGIDIWAIGCILAELLTRKALFRGENDLGQMFQIFSIRGSPTEEVWPGVSTLKCYFKMEGEIKPLSDIFTAATPDVIDVIDKCLMLCPAKRPSAKDLLQHEYFSRLPPPIACNLLPNPNLHKRKHAESKMHMVPPKSMRPLEFE